MNHNQSILYLGVFAQGHRLPITVSGYSKDDFITVVSTVLNALNDQFFNVFGLPVSYYYDTIDESDTDTTV